MGYYVLPLVGFCDKPSNERLMAINDGHMEPPAESDPRLYQLLPNIERLPVEYNVAGVHSGPIGDHVDIRYEHAPSHTVTALYTPDGLIKSQNRFLACRISLLDHDHGLVDAPERFHDKKVDAEFRADDRDAPTDWVDYSYDETQINGHKRTSVNYRKPILAYPEMLDNKPSRPVNVRSFVVQSTSWGTIEIGMELLPDPDPGVGLETVKDLADIVTEQVELLPRPAPAEDWPLFRGYEESKTELAFEMKSVIRDLSDQDSELKNECGAVLKNLLDRMCEDYELTRREARELLEVLDQNNELAEKSGLIRLA